MDAGGIFVERILEPYVGLPLLGVGGCLPRECLNALIEVRFDGEPAALVLPTEVDTRCHFSFQLPIEQGLRRVEVALVHPARERILFDEPIEEIRIRSGAIETGSGLRTRLFGVLRRGVRSTLNGEILSPARWRARMDRFSESLLKFKQRVRHKLLRRSLPDRSSHEATLERTRSIAEPLHRTPTISILMPVYNVEPEWFRAAVDSVRQQTYPHWELCIADDASTRVGLLAQFDRLPDDPRIRLVHRSTNGHICATSNCAADLAGGEFIALLDHDDALASNALEEVARAINSEEADLYYSDEDKIDSRNHHYDPQHKPEWSPELLLSYNYINHFTVIRRNLFERVGRFRIGYEGSQDHDLLLRVTEKTDRIVRIPKILYHWRSLPTSTASTAGVKSYVHTSGRRAVEDAIRRRNVTATLTVPAFAEKLGLPVLSLLGPDDGPSVAIIIHGDAEDARKTVYSLTGHTTYRNIAFYLVLDRDADTLNRLAAAREEDYLLFLAAGITPCNGHWLSRLIAYASIPGVGAVGGRMASDPHTSISYYFYDEVARNVSAPNRGVLLTSRNTFEQLGGFDADRFPESLFEQDYCARLRGQGRRCVHVGDAVFNSVEMPAINPLERLAFRRAHGDSDPYSNPHFANLGSFALAGDAGLIPAEPASPLQALVAAHNLNSPEGAPRYLSDIVLGLRDRGVLVPQVVSSLAGAGAEVYCASHVPVAILDEPWSRRFIDAQWTPRAYEAAQDRLIGKISRDRPDIVIANTLLTFPVVEAAARLGIPSLWIIHESYSAEVLARLFSPYARHKCESAFALASRVIPASHDTAALFRRCDVRHNIRVIHNGIDPASIDHYCREVSQRQAQDSLDLDPAKAHIITVGTVCERKGQHTLIEAAAILAAMRRDFVVHLIGVRDAVPYANYIRHLVKRRRLADCVNLVSETRDVFNWYRAADIFAFTSHMETFSRAILEAEAFSLPIVSTPCEGLGEQVVWTQNALRFEKNDAPVLANHLGKLVGDRKLRESMGRKSRAVFDAHSTFDDMLDRYQAVIQQATGWISAAKSEKGDVRKAA